MDRRYRRTETLLTQAMLALIQEKPYADITIDDIATRADVARKTFYNHYAKKSDLLWHSLETHFEGIVGETSTLDPETLLMDGKPLSYPVFQHVKAFAVFYRSMLADDGDAAFILRLWDYIAEQSFRKHGPLREVSPMLTLPPDLVAEMLTGALLGAVRWWLHTDFEATPEQMAYRFSQLMAPGVLGALGLDP